MMIKCQDCGFENQLGAIFCRNCGNKLDIDKMRPVVKDMKYKADKGVIVHKIIGIVVTVVVIAILAALVLPFGLSKYAPASADVQKSAKAKYDEMLNKIDHGKGISKHTFTPDEATAIYNSEFLAKAGAGANVVQHVVFSLNPASELVVDIETQVAGKMPVFFELVGTPSATAADFDVRSAKMGRVKMPLSILRDKIVAQSSVLARSEGPAAIVSALRGVEIVDGNFVLSVEAKPVEAAAKK